MLPGPRRRDRVPRHPQGFPEHRRADPDAHGAARGVGQGRRPRQRRRRLPDQAVRRPRADGARARAAAARPRDGAAPATARRPIVYKHIEMDPARRRVLRRRARRGAHDQRIPACCYVLLSNAGIVFSREALLHKVWKDEAFVTVRSVDTLVKRLRKKIERGSGRTLGDSDGLGRRLQGGRCLTSTRSAVVPEPLLAHRAGPPGVPGADARRAGRALPVDDRADRRVDAGEQPAAAGRSGRLRHQRGARRRPGLDLERVRQRALRQRLPGVRRGHARRAHGRQSRRRVRRRCATSCAPKPSGAGCWSSAGRFDGRRGFDARPPGRVQSPAASRPVRARSARRRGPRGGSGPIAAARGNAAPIVRRRMPWSATSSCCQAARRFPASRASWVRPWALVGGGVLAVGAALIAFVVFGPVRRRLRAVQDATEQLGQGDLGARAPDDGGDEVAALARSFNRMAEELAAARRSCRRRTGPGASCSPTCRTSSTRR